MSRSILRVAAGAGVVAAALSAAAPADAAPRSTTAVHFDAVRRKNTTVNAPNGAGIGAFKYNRKTVRPFAGTPLKDDRAPRSYRRLLGSQPIDPTKAAITDLNGTPILEASIEVRAANGENLTLVSDRTGRLYGDWPSLKRGLQIFTLRVAGYATTQVRVRVR